MDKKRTTLELTANCRELLETVKEAQGLPSMTAAIEAVAIAYQNNSDMEGELKLIKKYLNELRRNNYLILSLLNGIVLEQGISFIPPHHDPKLRSPAMQSAMDNLTDFLNDIMARQRDAQTSGNAYE